MALLSSAWLAPPEWPLGYDHHGVEMRITDLGGATDFRYEHSTIYYSNNLK